MGSHAQDSGTQKTASAGAQQNDATLSANAAKNQQFADQTRQSLFGNYDAKTGRYAGGSTSQFLDPSALNQTGLSGTYLNQYNNASNKINQGAGEAVATTQQNLANRGMGKSPAGFAADQERKAYQDAAGQQGDLYSATSANQHQDALNNYWNATNMLNANATNTANLSLQGNQAAAGNYANLYGTASQQQQSGWATAAGVVGSLGGSAITAFCPVEGSMFLMHDGAEMPVELLQVGDVLAGIDGGPQIIEEIQSGRTDTLRVTTDNGCVVYNSRTHAFALPFGGFVVAAKSLGKTIVTGNGPSKVTSVEDNGIHLVFNVITDGSHTYRADGVWALGVGDAERVVSMTEWDRIGKSLQGVS